jgi:hypothetical protein
MPRSKQEWIDLATRRIHSILAAYHCCPIRMLEAKISEAGPGDKRPNPLSITNALAQLTQAKNIFQIRKPSPTETPFYAPIWLDHKSKAFLDLLATRRHLYLLHKGLTERNDFCSDVLEQMLDTALVTAGASFLSRFPSPKLPASRPLDFVADIGGTRFGGEAKNYREWIYPDSAEIWSAISKCCELDAVPILITRKLPYISFLLFRSVGMIGDQTHFQFFHPIVEPELARVKHVDGLGYKDIRCVNDPDANMVKFFTTTLPGIGPDFRQRFASHKSLLQHFADGEKLRDDSLNPKIRQKVFAQAWKALVGRDLSDDLTV